MISADLRRPRSTHLGIARHFHSKVKSRLLVPLVDTAAAAAANVQASAATSRKAQLMRLSPQSARDTAREGQGKSLARPQFARVVCSFVVVVVVAVVVIVVVFSLALLSFSQRLAQSAGCTAECC